jgi:CRISPR-associated endonuclease Csn1
VNKTLCHIDANRRKGSRTPKEAFGQTPQFAEMRTRVKRFHGQLGREKLRRFESSGAKATDEFLNRKLNDTRMASRLAIKYLSCLYGGDVDAGGSRRIFAVAGGVTWYTRALFGMNSILGDGDRKTRDDHRHHAVDAVAIALSGPGVVKRVADLARRMESQQLFARFSVPEPESPWDGFLADLRDTVAGIVPSRRQSGRVRGALHEDTLYGATGTEGEVAVRKPLVAMSAREIPLIADHAAREAAEAKLRELGVSDPAKAFQSEANLPRLPGGQVIRRARIRFNRRTVPLGSGGGERHVVEGSNHHMEVVAVLDESGTVKRWEGQVVSLLECVHRQRAGLPVVCREHGSGKRFLFSLRKGDAILVEPEEGKQQLLIVRVLNASDGRIEAVPINDAREKSEIWKAGMWIRKSPGMLRKWKCQKMLVTPLGELRNAND